MKDFIETRIINAVRKLLTGKVNELLGEMENPIPLIEFSEYRGGSVVVPVINVASCELKEKERIIRQEAYNLTITFIFPDTPESELYCYAYSGAVGRAVYDDPALGGVVGRAVVTNKKYIKPKKVNCGEAWELVVTLRITVEGR